MERIVSGVEAVLIAISQAPATRQISDAGCRQYLSGIVAKTRNIASLTMVGVDGNVQCTTLNPEQKINIADQRFFQSALTTPARVIGEYTIGRISGKPVLPIALAVRDQADAPIGVAVATIDLAWLSATLKERGLPPEGSVTVADHNGTILARQPNPEQLVGSQIPAELMRLVNAPSIGVETVTARDGTRRVVGYVPLSEPPVGLYVSAGLSATASLQYVNRASRRDALFVVITTVATVAIAWFFGQRAFVAPLKTIGGVITRWRGGNRAVRTAFHEDDGEIAALGSMIDELLDEIASGDEQRGLVARELTHRVKNTFATVMAIANATFRKDEPAKVVLPTFLARMNALARTHDVLMGESVEGADLERLIRGVVAPLCAELDEKFRISGPVVELPPRVALAMTLVMHELCTNALKHGALAASGHIDIDWRFGEAGRKLELTWLERGVAPLSPTTQPSRGFGARLIAVAFGEFGTSKLQIQADAVICSISVALPEGAMAA